MLIPKKHQSWISLIILIILSLGVFSYSVRRSTETGFARRVVLEAMAPLQSLINDSVGSLADLWNRYLLLIRLEEENRSLRKEVALLRDQVVQYREGFAEAQRLKRLLALDGQFSRKTVAARVIDKPPVSVFNTITISKGSVHGLRAGLPVLTDQGVVGRIMETAWHASRVLLLVDGNSNIDALIQGSRTQGILQGYRSTGCRMKYVPKTEQVKAGDIVLSSGLGGTFPKGLILGVVAKVDRGDGGLFQRIDVTPAVDLRDIEEVVVLSSEERSQP